MVFPIVLEYPRHIERVEIAYLFPNGGDAGATGVAPPRSHDPTRDAIWFQQVGAITRVTSGPAPLHYSAEAERLGTYREDNAESRQTHEFKISGTGLIFGAITQPNRLFSMQFTYPFLDMASQGRIVKPRSRSRSAPRSGAMVFM